MEKRKTKFKKESHEIFDLRFSSSNRFGYLLLGSGLKFKKKEKPKN